jgi:PAS domain S-box-containing protein
MSQEKDSKHKKTGKIDFKDFVENLLVGAYQVDNQGKFIYVNDVLAEILGYPDKNELIGKNIEEFYADPNERKRLIKKLEKTGALIDETSLLKNVNNQEIYLSDSCQNIYDKNGEIIGVGGVIMEVWSRKVFDKMNEGIYQVGADQKTLVKVNTPVAKLFGYKYPEEIEGKDIRDFYKNPEDIEKLLAILKKEGFVKNYPVEMVTIDRKDLVISVNASLLMDDKGNVIGQEGTFRDITEDYKIRRILEDIPTGAYQVKKRGEKNLVTYCNKAFAHMFGYSSPNDIIGENFYNFYAVRSDIGNFERGLIDKDKKGMPMLDYRLELKKKNGENFWIEVDCHLLKDHNGKIIGRQGAVRDATIKIKLERMEERQQEMFKRKEGIQRFAHRFMAPITSIKATTDVFIEEVRRLFYKELFGPLRETFRKLGENPFFILTEIHNLSKFLLRHLDSLIELLDKEPDAWDFKDKLQQFRDELDENIKEEFIERIIELRETQRKIKDYLLPFFDRFSNKVNDKTNDVLDFLEAIDKFYILYLSQTITNTSKMALVGVENLRSYLSGWDKKEIEELFEFKKENLYECIREVVNIYEIYAVQKGIRLEISKKEFIPEIEMSQENIKKMLHYLIENAVKYSFKGRHPVTINGKQKGGNVEITIENFGVGILPEEIKSGEIFEYGGRGKFSTVLSRTGSGIGLAEARRIAEGHRGDIKVISKPILRDYEELNKHTPFVTKVIVTLPKFHGKKRRQ